MVNKIVAGQLLKLEGSLTAHSGIIYYYNEKGKDK
jgi:hypothetical protein